MEVPSRNIKTRPHDMQRVATQARPYRNGSPAQRAHMRTRTRARMRHMHTHAWHTHECGACVVHEGEGDSSSFPTSV